MRAFLALGANLGDRLENLRRAAALLDAASGVRVVRSSRVYETEAVGGPPQPDYLNAVVEVETELSPRELLDAALSVERILGRVRDARWGPRSLDIDVLTYGDAVVEEPGLSVPHPRLAERAFVVAPLLELERDAASVVGRTEGEGWAADVQAFAPPLVVPPRP